jgi:hypothetical protein
VIGTQRYTIVATQPLAPGKHTRRFEFAYHGGGPEKAERARSSWTGQKAAEVSAEARSR